MNIAILGATGQIAQCVLLLLNEEPGFCFHLFARNRENLDNIRNRFPKCRIDCHYGYEDFHGHVYDAVINGISIGPQEANTGDFGFIWTITEDYDKMILSYLESAPRTKYISLSSGAAYGGDFSSPADEDTLFSIDLNRFRGGNAYAMAKAAAEARHRSFSGLNIIDLRIFAFFSRFINMDYRFLLCDILRAVQSGEPLRTSPADIMRDYIHLSDFRRMLLAVLERDKINTVVDVVSKAPAGKFEILNFYQKNYGMRYTVESENNFLSLTGTKPNYYSVRTNEFYTPEYTSLDCIRDESVLLLQNYK